MRPTIKLPVSSLEHECHYAEWILFHRRNPQVYDFLVTESRKLITVGHETLSLRRLWQVGRHRKELMTADPTQNEWKLNNNYTRLYALFIMRQCPDLDGKFETREKQNARKTNIQKPVFNRPDGSAR